MLREDQNIDLLFREGLKGHEEEVSASVWENMASNLDLSTETSSVDELFKNGLEHHEAEIPASLWANIANGLDEKASTPSVDSLFKSGLQNHEEAIPPFVWNNVSEGITNNTKKKKLYVIRAIAASIAILLSFTTGLLFTNYSDNNMADATEFENSTDLVNAPSKDIAASIEGLLSNVKKQKQNKIVQYADASLDFSNSNKNETNSLSISSKEISLKLLNSNTEIIKLKKKQKVKKIKSEEIVHYNNDLSPTLVSSVVTQKTYSSIANLNKNYELKTNNNNSGWIVGGYFSPVFSYRSAQTNESYSEPRRASADDVTKEIQDKDFYDEKEQGAYSYASGLSVEYKTKNRWSLQSGVYMTNLGQVTDNISRDLLTDIQQHNYIITTSAGSIAVNEHFSGWEVSTTQTVNEIPETVELLQNFEYVEIPMNVKFNVLDDNSKFSVNIVGGISTNVLLKNRAFLQYEDQKYEIGETNNINKFIYNSNLGLGVAYKFTKKISMNIEPNFKYSLVPLNKNYPIYYRPYYFTVFTGISYKF